MGSFRIRVPKYQSGLLANGEKGEKRKVIFHCVIIKWKFTKMNSKFTYDTLGLKRGDSTGAGKHVVNPYLLLVGM